MVIFAAHDLPMPMLQLLKHSLTHYKQCSYLRSNNQEYLCLPSTDQITQRSPDIYWHGNRIRRIGIRSSKVGGNAIPRANCTMNVHPVNLTLSSAPCFAQRSLLMVSSATKWALFSRVQRSELGFGAMNNV
jgi:hypothetical protein